MYTKLLIIGLVLSTSIFGISALQSKEATSKYPNIIARHGGGGDRGGGGHRGGGRDWGRNRGDWGRHGGDWNRSWNRNWNYGSRSYYGGGYPYYYYNTYPSSRYSYDTYPYYYYDSGYDYYPSSGLYLQIGN